MQTAATGPRLTTRYRDGSRARFSVTRIDAVTRAHVLPGTNIKRVHCRTGTAMHPFDTVSSAVLIVKLRKLSPFSFSL